MRRWISIGLVVLLAAVVWVVASPTEGRPPGHPIVPSNSSAPGRRRWHRPDRRMVGILLEKEIGQPVTVVNRTGGSGLWDTPLAPQQRRTATRSPS